MIVLAETSKQKGGYINSITNLLDLEDTDIEITDIQIQGQTKTLTLSTPPVPHFCPSCGFRMYSRGIKKRTINHPILQDNYSLVLILKQRRWRCTNPECLYDTSESFKFVNRQRRTTNATDMLIVDAYPWLLLQFGNSDTEEIGTDRVEALVSASPSDEDGETRETVVKTEIEDNDNDNLTIPQVVNRLGMVFFLLIFNLGITIFIVLLTGMMLFSQILFTVHDTDL